MNANNHPYKVTAVDSATMTANDHPFKVLIEGGAVTPEQFAELEAKVDALATDLTFKGSVETYDDLPETADDGDTYLVSSTGILYTFVNNDPIPLNEGVNVVQAPGTSTTDVMSQDAATKMIFRTRGSNYQWDPARYKNYINIGGADTQTRPLGNGWGISIGGVNREISDASVVISPSSGTVSSQCMIIGDMPGGANAGAGQVSIGYNTGTNRNGQNKHFDGNIYIGYNARANVPSGQNYYRGAISLGAYSTTHAAGEMNIGSSNTNYGYNDSNYRLLSGLYDPQAAHDAATKGYVDGLVGDIETALSIINNGGN